jgi:bifunctional N-acetylglucosamine-1-phosphate-uridyltransferase/glucosamine-1-phosphate-acetyltransferase GlmU-like protein
MENNVIVINTILDFFENFIDTNNINKTGEYIINKMIQITNSNCGFISQFKSDENFIIWGLNDNSCTQIKELKNNVDRDLECSNGIVHINGTLLSKIIKDGDYLIDNNVNIELPKGHQDIKTILGIPLFVYMNYHLNPKL